jgi:hypothetical protein
MLTVALPVTGKANPGGLGVLPRGSVSRVDGSLLRFFVYWKQREQRTDFDLSALLMHDDVVKPSWLSWTQLRMPGAAHSGDITEAPDGASEFIDLDLTEVSGRIVVPQVNVYAGEGFHQVEESFFGFMLRGPEQQGRPFEPRTVRMKSELRGLSRVALPMAFVRDDDNRWRAMWLHLHLSGLQHGNRVEDNRVATTLLVRTLLQREFLTVGYLLGMLPDGTTQLALEDVGDQPVTYIGLTRPDGLPAGSTVITPANLGELIPR